MTSSIAWARAEAVISRVPGFTLAVPNKGFNPEAAMTPFVRMGGRSAAGGPVELGRAPIWDEDGVIECAICIERGIGSMPARRIAADILAEFRADNRDREASPVIWGGYAIDEGEEAEKGAYWVLNLQIWFRLNTALVG